LKRLLALAALCLASVALAREIPPDTGPVRAAERARFAEQ